MKSHSTSPSPTRLFADDGVELTLAHIGDLEQRKMTAQLMAIAPDIPIADLYHLLMDRQGRFDVAKQDVLRMSSTSLTSLFSARSSAQTKAGTVPLASPTQKMGAIDKPIVKIDFDDPRFIWDIEVPTTPPQGSRTRKRYSRAKNQGKATKVGSAGDINRGMRETSYDREFIIPDDEILSNSDASYSDSNQSSSSDIDMMDIDSDLAIDMQPEYAYNSDILSSPSGAGWR